MPELTPHTQRLDVVLPLLNTQHPDYVVAIDPDPVSAQAVHDMGIKLIVRHFGPWDQEGMAIVTPITFADECAAQRWWPYAWAVLSPNEPAPPIDEDEEMEQAAWLGHFVLLMEQAGKQAIVGNWATGNDGYHVPGATLYSCHEYGWPYPLAQGPFHALRHANFSDELGEGPGNGWFEHDVLSRSPDAKLFITEFGATRLVTEAHDNEGITCGWKTSDQTATTYAAELQDYVQHLKPYVLAAAVFQYGGFDDWSSFECLGHPELEALVGSGQSTSEESPIHTTDDLERAYNVLWGIGRLLKGEQALTGDTLPSLGEQQHESVLILKAEINRLQAMVDYLA